MVKEELKRIYGIRAFKEGFMKEHKLQQQTQYKLPRCVNKVVLAKPMPIAFLPQKYRIDDSRGLSALIINGKSMNGEMMSDEMINERQSLYTALLKINTTDYGAIETIEYYTEFNVYPFLHKRFSKRVLKGAITYHQSVLMGHLRSIFMGLFEKSGATRKTCDIIIFLLMKATNDGSASLPVDEFDYRLTIAYQPADIPYQGERVKLLIDMKPLYQKCLESEENEQ